jgi:hypothetical protein
MAVPVVVPLVVPLLAPLSFPLLRYWSQDAERLPGQTARLLKEALEQENLRHAASWTRVEQVVVEKRDTSFQLINGVLQAEASDRPRVPMGWLLRTVTQLMPGQIPFQRDTLQKWSVRGVVRTEGRGSIEPQSAAEVVTARQVVDPERERAWMDSHREKEEPFFHVWMQVEPNAPAIPWPYPLSPDTPPDAVIWTPWPGAGWDPMFVPIEGMGAIRFAGAAIHGARRHWLLSKKQLRRWDPDLLIDPGILERAEEAFDSAATLALVRLAVDLMATSLPPRVALTV